MGRRPDPQAQEFARILDEYRSTRTQLIRPPETDRDKREKGEHQLRVVQSLLLVLLVCLLAVALGMATHVSHDSSHFGSRTPSDKTLRCISLQDLKDLYRLGLDVPDPADITRMEFVEPPQRWMETHLQPC